MPSEPSLTEARAAKELALRELSGIAGVLLAGIGLTQRNGGYALKVNLVRPAPVGALPPLVSGVPLVVEVVGQIQG